MTTASKGPAGMSRSALCGVLLFVLLSSRTVWGRCRADRALSSDDALLHVMCTKDEAKLEWSHGELAVEYITLEYSCHNYTGNISNSEIQETGINPTGTVVDNDKDFSSSTAFQVPNWGECTFSGCLESDGFGLQSFYFFTPVACTWPISAETHLTFSTNTNFMTTLQPGGVQYTTSAKNVKQSSLSSITPTEDFMTSLQAGGVLYMTSAKNSTLSILPSTTPTEGSFVNGTLGRIDVTVAAIIPCIVLVCVTVILFGLCILIRRRNHRHRPPNYWKVFLDKEKIISDHNFELVNVAAPPFMLASMTSLVSEFDKLNCSTTERNDITMEAEIPEEFTKKSFQTKSKGSDESSSVELPAVPRHSADAKGKTKVSAVAHPLTFPPAEEDFHCNTKEFEQPPTTHPSLVLRSESDDKVKSQEAYIPFTLSQNPTDKNNCQAITKKFSDSYIAHPFITLRPQCGEGKSKELNDSYVTHSFDASAPVPDNEADSRELEDALSLVLGDETLTDMKKCIQTKSKESENPYITLPFKVPASMGMESCQHKESNRPYIVSQFGSPTVTDSTESQIAYYRCGPPSSAKDYAFEDSVQFHFVESVDVTID